MTSKLEVIFAVLLAALVWSLRWGIFGLQPPVGDGPMYLAMAGGAEGSPPWLFHILTPRLAGFVSPRDPAAGFFVIAAFSFLLAAAAIVVMLGARPFGTDARERLLGAALFMTVYPGVAMFRAYFLTDSLTYALLAVAVAAAVHRCDGVLALATLIGIFNRETAFFVAPVWLVLNIGEVAVGRLALRSILVFGPAVAGYILLHHTPLFFGHYPAHLNYLRPNNISVLWNSNLSWLGTESVLYGLAICVFLAFGPVWFVSGYGYYRSFVRRDEASRFLLALGTLAFPTVLALMVVDWRRGFQPLFPAVVAAAVVGLRAITASPLRLFWYLAAGGTVLAANFTTEAWWSRKISIPVGISMSLWFCIMAFVLTRNWTRGLIRGRDQMTGRPASNSAEPL